MANIKLWCSETVTKVKSHSLVYLEADTAVLESTGVASVAASIPTHYAAPDRIADILRRLGKSAVADYVQTKLPQGAKSRSGDLGEILATSYVSEFTGYSVGVFKLRWSDHREMAMRGDDILGIRLDSGVTVKFLKGEVKSRANLGKKTVDEARTALASSNGRPTPHALAFVADRLFETDETDLAEVIDQFQLKARIEINQLSHLMFTFTGNNPSNLLTANLNAETAARQAADTTLTNNLNAETAARQAADTTLTNNLNNEIAARQAADTTLTNNLNAEITRATNAENAVQTDLNNYKAQLKGVNANGVNNANNPLDWSNLKNVPPLVAGGYTAGPGISINGGVVSNTGVLSVIGGGGVNVSAATGNVTFSTTAGGDLAGSLATATVARINTAPLGTTTPTSGNLLVGDGAQWNTRAVSGDATLSGTGALTLSPSGVAAGTYGSTSQVPRVTVDSKGRVTTVTNVNVTVDASAVTTGLLPIARGGTNSGAALNNNRVMVSSGGAIVEAPALTDGQILVGATGGAPAPATIAGTANRLHVTNGPNSIALNVDTALLPSPAVGDSGKALVATGANTAAWTPVGSVTQVNTGAGLVGGPITTTGTIALSNTGVAAVEWTTSKDVPCWARYVAIAAPNVSTGWIRLLVPV